MDQTKTSRTMKSRRLLRYKSPRMLSFGIRDQLEQQWDSLRTWKLERGWREANHPEFCDAAVQIAKFVLRFLGKARHL